MKKVSAVLLLFTLAFFFATPSAEAQQEGMRARDLILENIEWSELDSFSRVLPANAWEKISTKFTMNNTFIWYWRLESNNSHDILLALAEEAEREGKRVENIKNVQIYLELDCYDGKEGKEWYLSYFVQRRKNMITDGGWKLPKEALTRYSFPVPW